MANTPGWFQALTSIDLGAVAIIGAVGFLILLFFYIVYRVIASGSSDVEDVDVHSYEPEQLDENTREQMRTALDLTGNSVSGTIRHGHKTLREQRRSVDLSENPGLFQKLKEGIENDKVIGALEDKQWSDEDGEGGGWTNEFILFECKRLAGRDFNKYLYDSIAGALGADDAYEYWLVPKKYMEVVEKGNIHINSSLQFTRFNGVCIPKLPGAVAAVESVMWRQMYENSLQSISEYAPRMLHLDPAEEAELQKWKIKAAIEKGQEFDSWLDDANSDN